MRSNNESNKPAVQPDQIGLFGSIQKSSTGRYHWVYRDADGRQRWVPLRPRAGQPATRSRLVAQEIVRRAQARLQTAPRAKTDAELLEDFSTVDRTRCSHRTGNDHYARLRRFLDWLAARDIRIEEADAEVVENYLVGIAGKYAPATVHAHRAALSRFFRWAQRRRIVGENPVALIDAPTIYHRPPESLTRAQLDAVLAACDPSIWPMVVLAEQAGLRLGEIRELRPDDVQPDGVMIGSRRPTKTYLARLAPLSDAAREAVATAAGHRSRTGFLFRRWPASVLTRRLRSAMTAAGLAFDAADGTGVRVWRKLRSTAATRRARAGASVWDLMREFGWRTPQTATRYVQLASGRPG